MDKQSALEWLAIHLHQWPTVIDSSVITSEGYSWMVVFGKPVMLFSGGCITEGKWKAQRKLNNKGANNEQ